MDLGHIDNCFFGSAIIGLNSSISPSGTVMDLQTKLITLGPGYRIQAKKLSKLNLLTVKDLLYHIPNRYEDLRLISRIREVQAGETVTIQGVVQEIKNEYRTRRMIIQKAIIADETGTIEVRWFNQPYLLKSVLKDSTIAVSGEAGRFGKSLAVTVKEFEVITNDIHINTGRLVPIYPLTAGMSHKFLRNKIFDILQNQKVELEEFLPEDVLLEKRLVSLKKAINCVHFPADFEEIGEARKRLSYDELLLLQLAALERRHEWEKEKTAPIFHVAPFQAKIDNLFKAFPFTLTTAQIKALDEIYRDFSRPTPMNRLLEGDVGSGKTVVAAIALFIAVLNGYQGVFMAPTEILANQHYEVLKKLLDPLGIRVALVTGSKKLKIEHLKFQILIGTHALLNSKIEFQKLGLVVIDEQQRFGVEQRALLREKGENPHFLTMTATPIPRTVFLTIYGDLSLSVLDEMPKGRVRVKTWLVPNEKRAAGYEWIKKKILETDLEGNKNQVFIICPFIEESESAVTVKAATKEFERLSQEVFKDFQVGLLHGKMKTKEKDTVLADFAQGKLDVLVATPVVEVGIDIPHATIMVIEAAERFGLSQLHQLRGRVGRRQRESFCLLYTDSVNQKTRDRLKSLEKIYIGAELAELDLKLRGPGDMYGVAQSGGRELKIASFSDFVLIRETKEDAARLFPQLSSYPALNGRVREVIEARKILPD